MVSMRALLIQQDRELALQVRAGLNANGFACDIVAEFDSACEALSSADYAALIVDLDEMETEGRTWLRSRKAGGPPVIVLTARAGPGETIVNLDSGADDSLTKPIDVLELAARLRALMRRPQARFAPTLKLGDLEFHVGARSARFDGKLVELTKRECDLLELLMLHQGALVTRATIENALFTFDDSATPNAIEACVSRLRRKLSAAGAPDLLVTVRSLGYRFG